MSAFYLISLSCLLMMGGVFAVTPMSTSTIFFFPGVKTMLFASLDFSPLFIKVGGTVLVVSACVFAFSCYYMKEDPLISYFMAMVFLFILSMIILCLSNSIFFLFLGWDGLGVTSFILIMFYSNWKSMNNSMVTLLSNRIGDGLFLFFISIMVWDFFSPEKLPVYVFFSGSLIFLTSMTKSAQIPISAWLPAAMAAPTPVSALVHSSTLVTAGIILLLKFYFLLFFSFFQQVLLVIGLGTIFIAGLSSLMEMDFKKLVALSTLSQMGMLFFILGLGSKWFTLFHLMAHAFFKSCLFLIVGSALHFMFSQQDWRAYKNLSSFSFPHLIVIFICVICLCGLFFSSGFISKDMMLDFMNNKKTKSSVSAIFLLSLFLTFLYSTRLFFALFKTSSGNSPTLFFRLSFFSDLAPAFLFFLSISFSLWFFYNFLFFFSTMVMEKSMFLMYIMVMLLMLLCLIISSYLAATMFFLAPLLKMTLFEKNKYVAGMEKTCVEMSTLFFIWKSDTSKTMLLLFLSKTKNIGFLLILFMMTLFFVSS